MKTSDELPKRCDRCGATLADDLETVPYVGPGARVVDLREVHVTRCSGCTNMTIEVPEPRALDTLIRCLGTELSGPIPPLAYEMGHWCILPRRSLASHVR